MCLQKVIEKSVIGKKLICEWLVLFVPNKFGCPMTHLQFKITFREKFQELSDPYDET